MNTFTRLHFLIHCICPFPSPLSGPWIQSSTRTAGCCPDQVSHHCFG
uniref:Uncharacterized protein n=1 Tax=Anguilla anguilla TaxID=7936 RepID=A0A0E9W9T8_ANGAN